MRSFSGIESYSYFEQLNQDIITEINSKKKEYILGVDEIEFKQYLKDKFSLEPLEILKDTEKTSQPTISTESNRNPYFGGDYKQDAYNFTFTYSFLGSANLFRVRSSTFVVTSHEINVNESLNTVSFSFKIYQKDPAEFTREKTSAFNSAFANVENINRDVAGWNQKLSGIIDTHFRNRKQHFLSENDFFSAINLKINSDSNTNFSVPVVRKKIVPQPTVPNEKEFASEPLLATKIYDDILKEIYNSGKGMEKKPSLYLGKDEEGLRDQFLFILESRYDGTTASGETFNRAGKTDILLKYANDGSNLFVAECKFWHGTEEFLKAISQLFDRYLTWRDSKTALLIFVKNKDFTNVLNTIKSEIIKHPYYKSSKGERGESSYSYIFSLPQDNKKSVFFEVIAFHYDKEK